MSEARTPEELNAYLDKVVATLDRVTEYTAKKGRPKKKPSPNQLSLEL